MWILAAIGPHLEELHLYFEKLNILLPASLFINCTNLVSLSLDGGGILVEVKDSSVHFPSLKILRLGYDVVDSEVVFLSGCPKLETLDIIFMTDVHVPPSSSSKWLKSTNHNFTWSYFEFYSEPSGHIQLGVIGNFDSMVEAFLDLRHSTSKWPLHAAVLNYLLTFAEYLLRNGLVLEKMLIFVDTSMDLMNKYNSVKRLLDIPRGSVKCQLKFDPAVSS